MEDLAEEFWRPVEPVVVVKPTVVFGTDGDGFTSDGVVEVFD